MKENSKICYVEPSVFHLSKEMVDQDHDEIINKFLSKFDEVLCLLQNKKCKIIMDRFSAKYLIDYSSNEVLIPVKMADIHDTELKKKVGKIQNCFFNVVNPETILVDTDICSVDAEKSIEPVQNAELSKQDYYYDFFCSMVGECYRQDVESEFILVLPGFSKIIGDKITIGCKCHNKEVKKRLQICSPDSFVDEREENIKKLKTLLHDVTPVGKKNVMVVQAAHAPAIGNTVIDKYTNIPMRFRMVLDVLIKFGMKKIDLRDWKSHHGVNGSIHSCLPKKEIEDLQFDILEGWLILDDRSCKCQMYFPKGIPDLLIKIIGNKIEYNSIITLSEVFY